MSPIVTRPEESAVLRALLALVPHLGAKLADPDAWRGLSVHEPDGRAQYRRLVCRQELVSRTSPPRCYLVGLHAFDRDHHGTLHNHRYPIAVLPLDPAGRLDEELHAMPWALCVAGRSLASGSMTVRSGRAWAIDRYLEVYHAVHSHRDYLSVNLSDITAAPGRENRLRVEPLTESQADEVRLMIAKALERLTPCLGLMECQIPICTPQARRGKGNQQCMPSTMSDSAAARCRFQPRCSPGS